MKRFWTILCLSVCLCMLPVLGSAMDAEEWDLTCLYTSSGGTVYELTVKELEDGITTATDLTYIFTPMDTLASGAAVKPTGEKEDGKVEIAYWKGGVRYGYVEAGSYYSDSISISANGKTYHVPKRATASEAMLRKSIALRYSGADVEAVIEAYYRGGDGGDGDEDDEETDEDEDPQGSPAKKTASDRMNPVFRLMGEDGSEQVVTLVTLGLVDSEVKLNGEVITVKTTDLTWDHDVEDAGKRLAVINAKRTGEATMHAKAKAKSDVLRKCDTNRVVVVLRLGKVYTRVLYDGVEGFVMTEALTFYPVGGVKEDEEAPVPGWVSYKGNVKSRQKINIRQNGKNGSRIVDEFKAGTPVWVFAIDGKWAEIEVGGYRAFILKQHVTLDESYQTETEHE